LFRDAFAKVSAAQILNDGVGEIAVGAGAFDSKNGRVFVVGQVSNFLKKTLLKSSIRHQAGMRNLDDDLAFELVVPGQVDGAHPATVQGFLDLVTIVEELADEPILGILFMLVRCVVQSHSSSGFTLSYRG
jgi:hypothetical protein